MGINAYIKQFATRSPFTGNDRYGKPSYGTDETIKVRFREELRRELTGNGDIFQSDAEIWAKSDQTLNLEDKISYGGSNYKIGKIDIPRDGSGKTHHKKAFLIKTTE
jgi:hypothetical protein